LFMCVGFEASFAQCKVQEEMVLMPA